MGSSVAIGMPVYNGAAGLAGAVESLLSQTFCDFRLLISDNASTDGTEEIAQSLATRDARVRYVRQPRNLGAAGNFRFVAEQSSDSKYFMWAAHDDRWEPDFISATVTALDADQQAGLAMTAFDVVSNGVPLWKRHSPKNPLELVEIEGAAERALAFAEQPFHSYKDNIVYSMWRTIALQDVMARWFAYPFSGDTIGGPMDELAVALYRGVFVPRCLFHKQYAGMAPGHPLEGIYRGAMEIKAKLRGAWIDPVPFDSRAYVDQILTVLRDVGISSEVLEQIRRRHPLAVSIPQLPMLYNRFAS